MQILDLLDCTGSGDVDTSKVVQADEEGCITGLYGNRLQLNPEWSNPSGAVSVVSCACARKLHLPAIVASCGGAQLCSLRNNPELLLSAVLPMS